MMNKIKFPEKLGYLFNGTVMSILGYVTGIYLMFVDPNYLGIGKFANPWSIAMLVKHILIVAMVGAGFVFNAVLRVGPMMSSNTGAEQAIARFGSYSKWMAISGLLVLLLTAIAQIE